MVNHQQRWFRLKSWLFINRGRFITAKVNQQNVRVEVVSWRHAFFGPAFRIEDADGKISHGWDPATLSEFRSYEKFWAMMTDPM